MSVEEFAAAMAPLRAAGALVREVAAMDPETSGTDEDPTCFFCACGWDRKPPEYITELFHASDCLWVRCNALVQEMDG